MSEDEIFVLCVSVVAGLVGAVTARVSSLPRPYLENNPWVGLMRLAVAASLAWTAFVIHFYGDESIRGVYVAFYLIMAYGVAKLFGQLMGSSIFGLHLRVDVYERKNPAAAVFIAAFILATGIVFGGSLWGEADPVGEGEGGWWIPVGFFLLGWGELVAATALYLWREPGRFRRQVRQERDAAMAWSAAVYLVTTATIILEGVAGDFWGWRHGILGMGTIALLLGGHEIIVLQSERGGAKMVPPAAWRMIERTMYIGLALLVWALNRVIDRVYTGA